VDFADLAFMLLVSSFLTGQERHLSVSFWFLGIQYWIDGRHTRSGLPIIWLCTFRWQYEKLWGPFWSPL